MNGPLELTIFVLVFGSLQVRPSKSKEGCSSPQYLEIGKTGIINCNFEEGFHGLFWYNSTDSSPDNLLLKFLISVKSGSGYDSGNYDIFPNGSLKINEVSPVHDKEFSVVKFQSLDDEQAYYVVTVITTVKPSVSAPIIRGCSNKSRICYLKLNLDSELTCVITRARPIVSLQWLIRRPESDLNLTYGLNIEQDGVTSTSIATTSVSNERFVLSMFVCKAFSLPEMLENDEVSVLVENGNLWNLSPTTYEIFVEQNAKLELSCSQDKLSLIVWKKSSFNQGEFNMVAFSKLFGETFSTSISLEYVLVDNGTLVVTHSFVRHEGLYMCLYENDFTGSVQLFHVVVYIPAYPVIYGCTDHNSCILQVQREGIIICSVTGIRPRVEVEVTTAYETDSKMINFFNEKSIVTEKGDTYDVQITLSYRIEGFETDAISLMCKATGSSPKFTTLTTIFELNFPMDHSSTDSHARISPFWMFFILIPLAALVFVCLARRLPKMTVRRNPNASYKMHYASPKDEAENSKLMKEEELQEKRLLFIQQLKGTYQDLCHTIRPIPYIKDRKVCVNSIFVESGLEVLIPSTTCRDSSWDILDSYRNIFTDQRVNSPRRILEGEPGYGKSMISLQLANEWITTSQSTTSPLENVEILILLRLRQLGGIPSIYRAIKEFNLPQESSLTENDIKAIMDKSQSALIILDGYDEYPDQKDPKAVVNAIICRQVFQNINVILTTRSSCCLPKKMPPTAKTLRLTGFNETVRDAYMEKAEVAPENVKRHLENNPILRDLCHVPLFFVLFVHVCHYIKDELHFNSVTSFFQDIIRCFHYHMENKMEDDNVPKQEPFKDNHNALDRIAFKGLTSRKQKIDWKKDELKHILGPKVYHQYTKIGILVERDTKIRKTHSDCIPDYEIDVQFFHQLFCEWYAAHYFAESVDKTDGKKLEGVFAKVDPIDLQFVYRFACGLNKNAAQKIISHFKSNIGGKYFVPVCLFEQNENISEFISEVTDLCSKAVRIDKNDSRLLQRTILQLLQIASQNKIPISQLCLCRCYSKVISSDGKHVIPLNTLKELLIEEKGREVTSEEVGRILTYASNCSELKKLQFSGCMLPMSIQDESFPILLLKQVEVIWLPQNNNYHLNLKSGFWERSPYYGSGKMTDEDYQREANKVLGRLKI